jgi:hypothetical protein
MILFSSKNNLVAGVERLAYRIQGNSCPGTVLPGDIINDYSNNEAHSAMSGVNLWPSDSGFVFDQGKLCKVFLLSNILLMLNLF